MSGVLSKTSHLNRKNSNHINTHGAPKAHPRDDGKTSKSLNRSPLKTEG